MEEGMTGEKKKRMERRKKRTHIRKIIERKQTRPDTRPISVADGWAGAEMRVFELSQLDHPYGPTDRRTDGQSLL